MFVCSVCPGGQTKFSDGKSFLNHYTFYHSLFIANGSMTCCHTSCIGRTFDKFNSFRKHIMAHKQADGFLPAQTEKHPQSQSDTSSAGIVKRQRTDNDGRTCEEPPPDVNNENNGFEPNVTTVNDSLTFDQKLNEAAIRYIANLYDCGCFTETQIQHIIESQIDLLGGAFFSVLRENVFRCLETAQLVSAVTQSEIKTLSRMFDSFRNMFKGYENEYLRKEEFESSGAYIKPQPYVIKESRTEKNVDGHPVTEPITLTGQFIPLRYVLKGFLELPNVLTEVLNYVDYLEKSFSESGHMENLMQGELWRLTIKPSFPGKLLLPLRFSFDDNETNKEIGTHTGIHKLGAGYIRLGCLPPSFASTLDNIFLAVLFHSSDRVAAGNEAVFRKVIDEIIFLEDIGISVCTEKGVFQVYFTLALVECDNLGANGVQEYVECFVANFFCRVCTETKEVMSTQTESNPEKLRTRDNYESDLIVNNVTMTGRKGACCFNKCKGYQVCENIHLDSMHDLDEGCWKLDMYFVVKYFCDKKRFSVEYLNELIQGFPYGPTEERNKCPSITKDDLYKYKRLKFSASEMRCLVRYFSIMVGHLVEEADAEVWNLYLKMRSIVDIVTAPAVSKTDAEELKVLIREHHSEFMRLFNTHLKAKYHFLTHYPELIIQVGPLEPLSCYRPESKHKKGKDVAHASHNRINLPLTIAKRHQLEMAFRFLSGRGFKFSIQFSVIEKVQKEQIKYYSDFKHVLPPDHDAEVWNVVKWLQWNGTKYIRESVVLHSFTNNGLPVFGSVRVISVCKANECFFVLKVLDVIKFDDYYHAYEVKETSKWLFVNVKNLRTHVPTYLHLVAGGKLLVPFRFSLKFLRKGSLFSSCDIG